MSVILETRNLSFGYEDEHKVLDNISISFEQGKTTAVLGANGAGKSTLFLNLNGILRAESGEVLYKGEPISYTKKGLTELRSKVGIVFQNPDDQLFSASVYQDISFGPVNMGLEKDEIKRRVDDIIAQTGLEDLKDRMTHSLSFGQKKRVAFAGVMVMEPDIIILDEPTAGLDPVGVSELMHLLKKICEQHDTTIILSTHDIDVVPVYADYIYVMHEGKILTQGTSGEIFSKPDILREHRLRLPRISHLLEILRKEDNMNVDFSVSTISGARRQIAGYVKQIRSNLIGGKK